jgi:MFS family permease
MDYAQRLSALSAVPLLVASRRDGTHTDSVRPVNDLALSLVLFAAAFLVDAVAPMAVLFMVAVLAGGLAYGGINPPTNVIVAGRMEGRLGFFMSVKQTGVPVGGFLAGVVLPPIAIWTSWRIAFAFAAVTALAVAGSTALLQRAAVLRSTGPAHAEAGPSRRERISMGFYGFVMAGAQWVFVTYLVVLVWLAYRMRRAI